MIIFINVLLDYGDHNLEFESSAGITQRELPEQYLVFSFSFSFSFSFYTLICMYI